MMTDPLVVTPSTILWLAQCPRRFERLAVKKQYPKLAGRERNNVLAFNDACHECLRHLYNPAIPGPLPHAENLTNYVRMAFLHQGFYRDEGDREYDMHRAHNLLCRYTHDDVDGPHTLNVELSGSFPVEIDGNVAFRVSGRLDRIIVRPDDPETFVCRDYKITSSIRPLDSLQVWTNLCIAKLAFKSAFRRYVLEIQNVTDDGTETTIYRSSEVKGIHRHVAALVKRHEEATEYPACRSDWCNFCPIRPECDEESGSANLSDTAFEE